MTTYQAGLYEITFHNDWKIKEKLTKKDAKHVFEIFKKGKIKSIELIK